MSRERYEAAEGCVALYAKVAYEEVESFTEEFDFKRGTNLPPIC
ncbi:hypothetical protein [Halonatronum saccharophilum]|nr:hypothetical protein [Halonatronum saccharophilum]